MMGTKAKEENLNYIENMNVCRSGETLVAHFNFRKLITLIAKEEIKL